MNTDYSPLPQRIGAHATSPKDNAIIFCIRIAEQCTSYLSPDISGYTEVRGIEYVTTRKSTGVFSVEKATKDAYSSHLDSVAETVPGRLVFTASDSSSVYGRTSGVSVPAAYTLMIIKA